MILASLDLGSRLGYSLGPIEAERPVFGTHQLPATGDDVGLFITAWDHWLRGFIARMIGSSKRSSRIVFESPILPAATQMVTLRKLYGLASHLEFVCRELGIECCEVNVMSVKLYWAGSGRASKDDMMAASRSRGFEVTHHDEGDALGVRFYMIHVEYPQIAARFPWAKNLILTA